MEDVIIIGAGVSGCSIARELSRYNVKVTVLEKEEDVASGTTKANSAIVHAGFDAKPNTLKAKLNVEGSKMMEQLSKDLDFEYKKNGALVVCTNEDELEKLEKLYNNGIQNGVEGLEILNKEQVRKLEKNLSDEVCGALLAKSSAIICPFGLTIALAENAHTNGVKFVFDTKVVDIKKENETFEVVTNNGSFHSKYVINAGGVYADEIHNMINENKLEITARSGAYLLLDKNNKNYVEKTIFPLPSSTSKGVLLLPTVHGNILVGPTAIDLDDKENVSTTEEAFKKILETTDKTVKNLPLRTVITSFAGLRANEKSDDFVIGESEEVKGFIDCAGIASPGLSSAPAIGKMISDIVAKGLGLTLKDNFVQTRKGFVNLNELSNDEINELIKQNNLYGNVVCRCELVTEGQIVDAINRPIGARSIDGIKRRVRQGMGRCQAGFCLPKTIEILSRELNIPVEEVTKNNKNSKYIVGNNKDNL